MLHQRYYNTNQDIESNLSVTSVPLTVNCAGIEYVIAPCSLKKSRHDYYLMFIIDGNISIDICGQTQILHADTYIVIEPETTFSYYFDSGHVNYYWIHFSGSEAEALIKSLKITTNTILKTKISDTLSNRFSDLFKEFLIKDERFNTVTNALLMEILSYISRQSETSSRHPLKSIEYICNNYNRDISLHTLADMENLSISWYRAIFKEYTGMSPLDFIINKRIDSACFYLKNMSMSVEEVSRMVGYENPFYFSRLFRTKIGMSPKQYSKSQKGCLPLYEDTTTK